jgi:8-amino-7-oxononanoate synthase
MRSELFSKRLNNALKRRRQENLFRRRHTMSSAQDSNMQVGDESLLNFCSNDYLGLANHPDVLDAVKQSLTQYGYGAGASHLVNGHSELHHQLEQQLAQWLGHEKALLFSTGFSANTALLNTLITNQDVVFQDKLNHASLIDGGLQCAGLLKRYRHLDMTHLNKLMDSNPAQSDGHQFIATDGVFSMDGDRADIIKLTEIANQRQATLIIDEAHSLGVIGEQGRGLVSQLFANQPKPIIMGTLGKAFGGFGAFVAADEEVIDYLIQFARPYIYTTAMPSANAAAALASLSIIRNDSNRRTHLNDLIQYFRELATAAELPLVDSQSPIQPIIIGESKAATQVSNALRLQGILVSAIRPPTVPINTARLRVTITANHTKKDIEQLVNTIQNVLKTIQIEAIK